MALADARAICPDLVTRPADLAQEAAALAGLCRWAGRYGPLVAADGADGLIADITGVPHLFGGEAALREDLHDRLARMGLAAASAIAGTRGAAFALARHGGGIIPDGALAEGLASLPVASLRIDHATVQALTQVGLGRIGDLAPLPRAALARRFGPALVMRLDQALDLRTEPIAAMPDPPRFAARLTLPEPIGLQNDVMAGLGRLLDRLCARLALHHKGARHLLLELHRVDQETITLRIGLARPMRDPARIAALFARHIEDIDAGFGIEAMRLLATVTEPLSPHQIGSQTEAGEDALADLISRLGNRLGFDHVLRLVPSESTIPERSFHLAPAAYSQSGQPPLRGGPPRPLFLFPPEPVTLPPDTTAGRPPARFRWRRMHLTTLRATGPERIAPEWWLDDPAWRSGLRDYWRIETREGPRLWLFHTPQAPGGWSAPGRAQDWYVQGEFA